MAKLTGLQAARAVKAGGFTGEAIVTALAIAKAENGGSWDTSAHGDKALAGRRTQSGETWGDSIGLFQIRSIRERAGTGDPRDPSRLEDPVFNAKAAYAISAQGTKWTDWSVYKSGAYRRYIEDAKKASFDQLIEDEAKGVGVGDVIGAIPGVVTNPGAALDAAGDIIGQLNPLDALVAPLKLLGQLVGTLLDPSWWRRLGIGALGLVLLVGAILLIVRDSIGGKAGEIAGKIPHPAAQAAAAVAK